MRGIEVRNISPSEMIQELGCVVRATKENKYAYQVGLKDVDFDINHNLLEGQGITIPFQSINHAEEALQAGIITPKEFHEYDGTEHQVQVFSPRAVGYSGFMDCVTHSLAITDQGLFDVGRYAAVTVSAPSKVWQWFLHRRLAGGDEIRK